jgi:hypothetical protein
MIFDTSILVSDLPLNSTIHEGWYQAEVVGASVKDTKNGLGKFLQVEYEIIGPTNAHTKVSDNINFKNPSEQATRIGLVQLRKLYTALHIDTITDESALINGETIEIMVKLEKGSDGYDDKNTVVNWRAINPNRPETGMIGAGSRFLS